MKMILKNQKTADTKFMVRHMLSFSINLKADQIDLYNWITDMTEQDYISYSPAHVAMNKFFKGNTLFMTNVENIGTDLVVQHYKLEFHSQAHVQLYSAKSKAFIFRWFPVYVGVPWEMQIRATANNSSELMCLIGADYPNLLLTMAAWICGLGGAFLRMHLRTEGKAFAKDIEEKFGLRKKENITTTNIRQS